MKLCRSETLLVFIWPFEDLHSLWRGDDVHSRRSPSRWLLSFSILIGFLCLYFCSSRIRALEWVHLRLCIIVYSNVHRRYLHWESLRKLPLNGRTRTISLFKSEMSQIVVTIMDNCWKHCTERISGCSTENMQMGWTTHVRLIFGNYLRRHNRGTNLLTNDYRETGWFSIIWSFEE